MMDVVCVYARVASADRVVAWVTPPGFRPDKEVKAISSGLHGNRRRLRRLIADHTVWTIVVEHRERLTRFGFKYVEATVTAAQAG